MNKKYVAELLGTMFLVLMGCGSAVFAGSYVGYLGIAFAFGLTVLVMVYAIGPISGCHINPAITTAMWFSGKIDKKDAINYMIYQTAGAFIGALILCLLASKFFTVKIASLGQNSFSNIPVAFTAETVFTALFIFVILGATSAKANVKFAGLAIGLALVLIHIVCIPITGTSVNPARSIGPALMMLFTGSAEAILQLWLFLLAPTAGAFLGAYLWKLVSTDEKTA
ncbi:MAG: aquaporin [Endomicrobia bacterium]|nr:aquaporin [Endomicrobiia bacterium]MCL2799199.1 aquaporin [Endomicrobiia bacterium]